MTKRMKRGGLKDRVVQSITESPKTFPELMKLCRATNSSLDATLHTLIEDQVITFNAQGQYLIKKSRRVHKPKRHDIEHQHYLPESYHSVMGAVFS